MSEHCGVTWRWLHSRRGKACAGFSWLAAAAGIIASCGPDATPTGPARTVAPPSAQTTWFGGEVSCPALGLMVTTTPSILAVGQTGEARIVDPAGPAGQPTWSSSDTAVATVVAGSDVASAVTRAVDAGWACISVAVTGSSSGTAGQARVAVPGVRISPKRLDVIPGDQRQLDVAAAVAPDGTPIPTSTIFWSVANPSLAFIDGSGRLLAQQVGATTVVATVNGVSKAIPLNVLPTIMLSGPSRLNMNTSGTYTAAVSGCNPTCTYQWSILWTEANSIVHSQQLGTSSTQTVVASMRASPPQFELDVAVTTNGVTRYATKNVYVATTEGCTVKTGC